SPITLATSVINSWTGGDCDWNQRLTVVCYGGAVSGLSDRTYVTGSTINTPLSKDEYSEANGGALHAHEVVHTQQWALFGTRFPVAYGTEEIRSQLFGCDNFFEMWAGLSDGGYE